MGRDKRRLRTAVVGNTDSDLPVTLPKEAIELDGFRAHHADQTFWCGVWLGSCGHGLVNKLYTDGPGRRRSGDLSGLIRIT
ncbi:hypothetical protein ACIF84_16440 [Streptomyces albidoflavus]